MTLNDVERGLRARRSLEPPPDLRARVLREAPRVAESMTWSDRVWFSRAWRIAAVAAAIGAVTLDSFSGTKSGAAEAGTPRALGEAQAIEIAASDAGLPPDVAETLARRALTSTARPVAEPQLSLAQVLDRERD